jgi:hypothetical protein
MPGTEVNAPMIRHWCEMMGIENPAYTDAESAAAAARGGLVAPATMLQAWCLEGAKLNNYPPGSTTENPYEALKLIEAQGYPSVVAVNSDLEFDRELRPGERLYYTTRLESIGDEKTTALGTGFFVTLMMSYFSQSSRVATRRSAQQLFRVFKFKPANPVKPAAAGRAPSGGAQAPAARASATTRASSGTARGGQAADPALQGLRHAAPPARAECARPATPSSGTRCRPAGRGTVYSFVVMHYPEVPPFDHPNPIALVELDEGTRLVAQLVGVAPGAVAIGQRVKVEFASFNDGGDIALPQFRPLAA